jgi:anti-sigma28 factor (negative regulator of flagellin synthesis)
MIKGLNNSNPQYISTISSKKKDDNNIQNVEKSRVDSIKEAVRSGTYKIDIEQTASKIAKTLI